MYRLISFLICILAVFQSFSIAQTGVWQGDTHNSGLTLNRNFSDKPQFDAVANELGVHIIMRDLSASGTVTNKYALLGNDGDVYAQSSFSNFNHGDVRIAASENMVYVATFNKTSQKITLRMAEIILDPYGASDITASSWNSSATDFNPSFSDVRVTDLKLKNSVLHMVYEANADQLYYTSYNLALSAWLATPVELTLGDIPGDENGYYPVLEVSNGKAHMFWLYQKTVSSLSTYRIMGRDYNLANNQLEGAVQYFVNSDGIHLGDPSKFHEIDVTLDEDNYLHVVAHYYQRVGGDDKSGIRYFKRSVNQTTTSESGAVYHGSTDPEHDNLDNMAVGIAVFPAYSLNTTDKIRQVIHTIGGVPNEFILNRRYKDTGNWVNAGQGINTDEEGSGFGLKVLRNLSGLQTVWERRVSVSEKTTTEIGQIWHNRFVGEIIPDVNGVEAISNKLNYWTGKIYIGNDGPSNTVTIAEDATVVMDTDTQLYLQGKNLVIKGVLFYDPSHVTAASGTISTDGIGLLVNRIQAPASPQNLEAEGVCYNCEVELRWVANTESDMDGGVYQIYRDEVYNSTGWSLGFEHVATVNHPASASTVSWIDNASVTDVGDRTLHYKIIAVDNAGYNSGWSNEVQIYAKIPKIATDGSDTPVSKYSLEENYPNPFNPTTQIRYQLSDISDVKLKIYNTLGQLVKTLVSQKQSAGNYAVQWDGSNDLGERVASGIYIYRIQAGDFIQSRKMILMK